MSQTADFGKIAVDALGGEVTIKRFSSGRVTTESGGVVTKHVERVETGHNEPDGAYWISAPNDAWTVFIEERDEFERVAEFVGADMDV